MKRSARATDGELSQPIGWWTQRLDVNMRDNPSKNPQVEMNALAGILTHLPNLRILTFSITGHRYRETLPANVLYSLICRDTLRIVHWYTPHFPSISSLSSFLKEHPHLESVNANEIMNTSIPQIQLTSLNTVHVHGTGFIEGETSALTSHIWTLNLPAVRYATYDLEFSGNNHLLVHGFFAAVGPKLRTIQLNHLGNAAHVEVRLNLAVTYVQILRNCHSLQQINLLFNSWRIIWLCFPTFPSTVHAVAFRILRGQVTTRELRFFFFYLLQLKYTNPSIKTIQLCSETNIRAMEKHRFPLQTCLLVMQESSISILDHQGNPMKSKFERKWTRRGYT